MIDDGAQVVVGGVITNLARKFTKRGDQMAVFVLEDLDASIEVTVFPRTLTEQGHKLEDDVIVTVKGRLDRRDESRFGLIGQTITVLAGLTDGPAPALRLQLPSTTLDELRIQRLKRILREHPGDSLVMIDIGQGRVLQAVRRVPRRPRPLGRRAAHGVRPRGRVALSFSASHRSRRASGEARARPICDADVALGGQNGRVERVRDQVAEWGTWLSTCRPTTRLRSPIPISMNWRRWRGRSNAGQSPRPRRTGS